MHMKTRRTHVGIACVAGDRKCTLSTMTEIIIDTVTKIIVNKRYLQIKGTTSEVGGINSANSKKNTVNDSRMLTLSAI